MPADSSQVWTIRSTLDWIVGYLSSRHDEHPRLSAEWLLADATGLSRVELYAYFDRPLDAGELRRLHDGVARRGRGEPLQYISGEVAFRHIVIKAERGVLIPRPETEVLVDVGLRAVDAACAQRGSARACDLCTGAGNVAASLLYERPDVSVTATDLSEAAVRLAERNISSLGLEERCTLYCCDLDAAIGEEEDATYDLVISNPPYIPRDELEELPREVGDYEPVLALDGGPDGLDVFRRIVDAGRRLLRPGGMITCELHETTLQAAAELCRRYYDDVQVTPDLAGRDRVVSGRLR